MLFRCRAKRQAGDLGEPVYQASDLVAELLADFLDPHARILHHIVQQCRGDSDRVEVLIHEDLRDLDGVEDVILSREPLLTVVGQSAEFEGTLDERQVQPILPIGQRLGKA